MIIPIFGKVTYQITLDPTVWIFDNRKIKLEDAFTLSSPKNEEIVQNESRKAAQRFEREFAQLEDPNFFPNNVAKERGRDVLNNSYVIPIDIFLKNAAIEDEATKAMLITDSGDIIMNLDQLSNSYFLFAINGKPLENDGPVHILFKDGSNRDNPIKQVKKVEII